MENLDGGRIKAEGYASILSMRIFSLKNLKTPPTNRDVVLFTLEELSNNGCLNSDGERLFRIMKESFSTDDLG